MAGKLTHITARRENAGGFYMKMSLSSTNNIQFFIY